MQRTCRQEEMLWRRLPWDAEAQAALSNRAEDRATKIMLHRVLLRRAPTPKEASRAWLLKPARSSPAVQQNGEDRYLDPGWREFAPKLRSSKRRARTRRMAIWAFGRKVRLSIFAMFVYRL